jgi:histidinol dehydrogenase
MSAVTIRVRGPKPARGTDAYRALFDRSTSSDPAIRVRTFEIVERVRRDGDGALRALAKEFDGVSLDTLEVPRDAWRRALETLDPALRRALERSAANIKSVHEAFLPVARETTTADGVVIGRRPDPLDRVGVYAPGGRATYPSSLLMGAIPARVAGVREVIVCSPPGPDGIPSPVLLAAAELASVDRVFTIGGAGAIAAMAFGTDSVPRVDRVVGPGNAYVAEAKLQVAGSVAIDAPAGPSELLVIADETADAAVVAFEMIAQAEHDPLAAVVLVTPSDALADRVVLALDRLVPGVPRESIVRDAFAARGGIVTVASFDEAVAFGSLYAAEHVLIIGRDAERAATVLRNSGTIFIGPSSSVAFGDYMTGANHVLPTGGLARSYSGLSTLDFFRWTTWQRVSGRAAATLASDVGIFADAEGLPSHAASARQWLPEGVR